MIASDGATTAASCVCKPEYDDEDKGPNVHPPCMHDCAPSHAYGMGMACIHRYYDEDEGPDVSCALCPSGSDCARAGTTLAAIPIYRGYYRRSTNTTDIRRCPDAGTNCGNKYVCPQTTSGCRGTVVARNETSRRLQSVNAPSELGCADGLTGLYCMVCDGEAFEAPV